MTDTLETITLYPKFRSRFSLRSWRTWVVIAFMAWLALRPDRRPGLRFNLMLVALLPVFVFWFARAKRFYLTLTADGFVESTLLGTRPIVHWEAIERFDVFAGTSAFWRYMGRQSGGSCVGFIYRPPYAQHYQDGDQRLHRSTWGCDGVLGGSYGMRRTDLAQLMNDWREGRRRAPTAASS